jgi:hypothetical protein
VKLLIALAFGGVVFSLGSALFQMTSRERHPAKFTRALMWRVAFSMLLVVLLLVAYWFDLLD